MDFFNIDLTLQDIEKADKELKDELDNITFEYNKLSIEGYKLLQSLNYSPKVKNPDINKIKKLPTITIPQLSELKNLDFSGLILRSNSNDINSTYDKEKYDMVKNIIISIIDNATENTNNPTNINNIVLNENEEFLKILRKNKKKIDEEKKRDIKFKSTSSRLGLEMNLLNQIKVYIFNSIDYIMINITPKDKIKSIKEKIIKKLIDIKKFKLIDTSEDAYEVRLINNINENNFIIDSPPLDSNESLFKEKIKAIAFLKNQKYINQNYINQNEINIIEKIEEKIEVKIYYKKYGINNSKLFFLSKDDTLKSILNSFFEQDILKNKNINQYYFVGHKELNDIENEINLNTTIQFLPSYELDLCLKDIKDFFEMPEQINEFDFNSKKSFFNSKSNEMSKGQKNSTLNEISAGLYQEYEVYKINKYKTKKKRILGIDINFLYNNLPKKKNSANILFKETKHPIRNIENIKDCVAFGDKGLFINIKEEDKEQIKILNYETKNSEIRNKIVDKIKFLINYHKNNN